MRNDSRGMLYLIPGALFWCVLFWHVFSLGRTVQLQTGLRVPWLALALISSGILIALGISSSRLLEIQVSDSVEYILSAQSLAADGTYALHFPERAIPPRFPVWFSLVSGMPFLVPAPEQPGLLVVSVALSALISIVAAFLTGLRLGGYSAGLFAALFLIGVPGYRTFSQSFLIDLPTTAIFQVLSLTFICAGGAALNWANLFRIAVLCAAAYGFRTTSIVLFLPFVWLLLCTDRKNWLSWLVLTGPAAAVTAINLQYNLSTFGSSLRTGYHAWVPIPYEFFSRTFSPSFLSTNLKVEVMESGLAGILFVIAALAFMRRQRGEKSSSAPGKRAFIGFIGIAGIPLLLIFSCYFYATLRFYLPLTALLSTWAAVSFSQTVPFALNLRRLLGIAVGLALLLLPTVFLRGSEGKEHQMAEIRSLCTRGTTLITTGNPLWLFSRLSGSCGQLIPLSRQSEFASKAYLPEAPHAPAEALQDVSTREFALKNGGYDIYRVVAREQWPVGEDILIETSMLSKSDQAWLSERYQLEETASPQVKRIRSRSAT